MFTSSQKQSKYISISHDYHEQWYPHDGSRCYFVKFEKKSFQIKGKSDIYNATNGTSSNVITIT